MEGTGRRRRSSFMAPVLAGALESAPSGENQLPSLPSRLLLLLVCICHLSLLSLRLQEKRMALVH